MSDDETGVSRKSTGPQAVRCGEPTQRFSALQQQLLCAAIHFFHRHIRSDPDVLQRMEGNQMFRLFFEVQYHNNKPDLNRIFPDSVHDCSALHVCSFILSILHQGIFSVSAFIVSVIYLSRFKESSHITLHACTWRPLFLTSLLLADKMWEDKPVRNSSLAKLFPVLSNSELNRMESEFLGEIRFNVLVKPDLFCSFCEKLLAEQVHQEISRCVNNSEYAATLQADHVETQPLKQQQQQQQQQPKSDSQAPIPHQASQQHQQQPQQQQQAPPSLHQPENAVYDSRYDPARVGGSGSRPGQVPVAWMEASAPSTGTSSVAPPGHGDSGVVPRSQSAGPTTTGSRRNMHAQPGAEPRPQQLHTAGTSQSLRSGVGTSTGAGPGPSKSSSTPQPPRSVSVHLHRNESQKKHSMGKVEDVSDKPVPARPGIGNHPAIQHSHHGGPPLRRSLPAKTSNSAYAPLARAPSTGAGAPGMVRDCHGAGVSTPLGPAGPMGGATPGVGGIQGLTSVGSQGIHELPGPASISSTAGSGVGGSGSAGGPGGMGPGSSATLGHSGGSGPPGGIGSAGAPGPGGLGGLRQPMQNTPRSPGGVSPVLLSSQQQHHHAQQQMLHQERPTSQSQGPQPHLQAPQSQQSSQGQPTHLRTQANRAATPPVPMGAHGMGSGGVTPGHSGGAPQGTGAGMTKLQSRGASPGVQAQVPGSSGGAGAGAQQPPRASSAPRVSGAANHLHHHHHTTPPTGSTVRTASQPMQAQGYHMGRQHQGQHGQHVPGSPSLNSPMVASTHTPVMPHHYGGGPIGMNSGRSGMNMAPGMQRNASPMGVGTPASPAGNISLQMPFGQTSMVNAQRPDLLSTTRGRSPPPAVGGPNSGPSTVRAPRAVTPGALVKGIAQSMHGPGMNVTRNSLGAQMVHVHRGIG